MRYMKSIAITPMGRRGERLRCCDGPCFRETKGAGRCIFCIDGVQLILPCWAACARSGSDFSPDSKWVFRIFMPKNSHFCGGVQQVVGELVLDTGRCEVRQDQEADSPDRIVCQGGCALLVSSGGAACLFGRGPVRCVRSRVLAGWG